MNILAPGRFLPCTLGKWLQKSHNIEMLSYDIRTEKVIIQIDNIYRIFGKTKNTSRRTNYGSFIYKETCSNYIKEQLPVTASWQGYTPNIIIFMQGYIKADNSHRVKNRTKNKVINDRYIRVQNQDNKYDFNEAAQNGKIRVLSDTS